MSSTMSIRTVAKALGGYRRTPIAFRLAVAFLLLVILVALAANWVAPHDPDAVDFAASLSGPTAEHLLGADQSGRDVLSRLLYGTRTSLIGPLCVLVIATALGAAFGLAAAWFEGWPDTVLSRITDIMLAFPGLLFAVFTIAILGRGLPAAVVALGIAFYPTVAKLTRSVARAELRRPYIEAYRLQGLSGLHICVVRVLPNIAPVVLGYAVVLFGDALLGLAGLSYLGLGAQPPSSDWGLAVSEGQLALIQGHFLPALVPAVAIVLTAVAVNIVGVRAADLIAGEEPA